MTLFRKAILIPILIILSVSSGIAQDCFAPSPTYQGNTKFPPISARELTKAEYEDLNKFLKSIVGEWRGTGEEIICRGSIANPSREIVRYTIKGKSVLDHFGYFSLKIELHSAEKNVSSYEKHDLYLTEKTFRADNSNSTGDIEMMEISAKGIRYRKRSAVGGSYPFGTASQGEMFTTLSRSNNEFIIEKSYYFQGRHTGSKQWRLSK